MASRKRLYDAEFREGAVRIVTGTGKPIPEAAADLGIHSGTLHSWVSRAARNTPRAHDVRRTATHRFSPAQGGPARGSDY
ncbi:transposase [Streptomyces sp. NPDC006476]|uniref:transposase n=1 Tax=Streptomyces sp. NPDC006476 TaxID=3157175 RepID=UPI0033B9BA36